MASLWSIRAEQLRELPILANAETCKGKVFIITGANAGLGFETTKHLVAAQAAKVIMACRTQSTGEQAKNEIEAATGRTGVMDVWSLDLGKFDSVKAFAGRVGRELGRVDGLVANASVALPDWSVTEGHETTVTTNIISNFLLIVLLYPKISQSAKKHNTLANVVIVGSSAAFMMSDSVLDEIRDDPFGKLDTEGQSDMSARYRLTKLLQLYAMREFALRLPAQQTGIAIDLVNPGLFWSKLARSMAWMTWARIRILNLIMGRTAEMASRTVLHALTVGEEDNGSYLTGCEVKNEFVPTSVTGPEGVAFQKRFWDDLANIIDGIEPGSIAKLGMKPAAN